MTKDEDFMLLKIQTCVLRVNIDCDGCNHKVKKLLQRIEGVYQVSIDAEHQKVTVSGIVDPETLIKKLTGAGKPAELWSQKTPKQNQNQNQKGANNVKEDKGNKAQKQNMLKNLEALKNQQKFHYFCEGDEDCLGEDGMFDDEDEMLGETAENRLAMLRQQSTHANNNAKKNVQANAAGASSNNAKATNNPQNGNAGKKKNQNQNITGGGGGVKSGGNGNGNPGGIDAKTMAALQMNNLQIGAGNANPHLLQGKGPNDMNAMMNLAGYHGNGANNISPGGFQQVHQIQPNNPFQGPFASSGYNHPSMMMNMNGYQQQQINNHPSVMMNLQNLQNRHALQQPQMMYNVSPFVPPATGYYYNNYGPSPDIYQSGHNSATHMFSDDNPSSCSIM